MIRIQQIKLAPKHTDTDIERQILKQLGIPKQEMISWQIAKRSIDARKKEEIKVIYTIDVCLLREEAWMEKNKNPNIMLPNDIPYRFPDSGSEKMKHRPVIIGMGPAGLFAALFLAERGYSPILLERGEEVDKRAKAVEMLWKENILNTASNVQFGEGGAGTFSDGKLNTLVKDTFGRNKKVLQVFVQAGAPEDILYTNKAHIGTDVLRTVVKNIRKRIIECGGEVRFSSQVTDLLLEERDGGTCLKGVVINGAEQLLCDVCVLAIGHSARDTFSMLYERGLVMSPKPFAVGVRMEHPQRMINIAQYGEADNPYLPVADYKVTFQASNGRSVYSFCMCPGGYVVNASSEENRIAVNGMSYHDRSGENANSAIIVSVTPEDFGSSHPLAGVEFQRRLEEAAYREGKGKVPLQLFGDFKNNQKTQKLGYVNPCVKGQYAFANLKNVLPEPVSAALEEGIHAFAHKIKGFDREDAVMEGVESRTSSPVRIFRDEEFENNIKGLYPCGEGAGYAGGITSAAMDGIKIAEAVAKRYQA